MRVLVGVAGAVVLGLAAVTFLPTANSAEPAPHCPWRPFADVETNTVFCGEIFWLRYEGYAEGYPKDPPGPLNNFFPTSPMTRQAMAGFLFDAEDLPPCTEPPFNDVPTTNPFCAEITAMVDQGITNGYADGSYRPQDTVNRQEMAAFLVRLATGGVVPTPCTGAAFRDVVASNTFCATIEYLSAIDVVDGYGNGTFRPTSPVSRQAMAAYFYRLWGA